MAATGEDSRFWRFLVARQADILRGVIDIRQLSDVVRLLELTFINCVVELMQPATRGTSRGGPVWQSN